MAQIDWRFMQPLDQSNQIAAMAAGNQQINAGLAAMGNAVTGYADALKQRNTDEILNALYQAQNSQQLPNAMQAVQALQQQYGRGYDQATVRNAVDNRSTVLGQRDLQNINLQQAQAAQAAIPTLNAAAAQEAIRRGMNPEDVQALSGLGINASDAISRLGTNLQADTRYDNALALAAKNRAEDQAYRAQRDLVGDSQWQQSFGLQQQNAAMQAAQYLAPNAGNTTQVLDADGNVITTANPSRADALAAGYSLQNGGIVDKIIGTESGGNATAKNPNSSATGAGQFISSTWLNMMNKYAPDLIKGKSESEILAMRNNPTISRTITGKYAEENGQALKAAGLPVNDGTIYLAHFAGPDGAKKLLQAKPGTSAESILGSKVAAANGNIVRGKTAQDVINWAAKQVGAGPTTTAQAATAAVTGQQPGIAPATLVKLRGDYNTALNKAALDYNKSVNASATKGSAAEGGNTPSKWLAAQKEWNITGGSSNPMFTGAADMLKMAEKSDAYKTLPPAIQANILDAAYSRVKNAGALRYETNNSVKTIIDNMAKEYKTNQVNQFQSGKKAAFDTAFTALQQAYQGAGAPAPDRKQAMKLLNPQLYAKTYGKK